MPTRPGRSPILPRLIACGIGLVGSLVYAATARGVVTADPIPEPANGWIGTYRGSTCVAVGSHWFITAKHTGDGTGQAIFMRGQMYNVIQTIPHPIYDVQLLQVQEEVEGYHSLATTAGLGDPCVLGGMGATAGAALPDHTGYDWTGPHVETWGENMIEGDGMLLAVRFDAPDSDLAIPHEAIFAINDSGGGLFVYALDGSLQLAGIAVSVVGFGSSAYGSTAFALNVDLFRTWMQPIVNPTQPISSAMEAPRAALEFPGVPGWLGGTVCTLALASRRRR